MDMSNAAYTNEYLKYREKVIKVLFIEENFDKEDRLELTSQIYVLSRQYSAQAKIDDRYYNLLGAYKEIYKHDKMVYSYHNIDEDGAFCSVVQHRNGKEYLVFSRELYGYSVLDFTSLKDYHYAPAESFQGRETFIWCDVAYSPVADMLAVTGCYWAAPFGVTVADFSSPLKDSKQFCLSDKIDNAYEIYDDIDFAGWEDTGLALEAVECEKPYGKNRLLISLEDLRRWMAE